MLPVFELAAAHVERLAVHLAKLHIGVADHEFAARIAHRGAAVAAAPRLVKHQRPVLLAQDADEVNGEIGGYDLSGGSAIVARLGVTLLSFGIGSCYPTHAAISCVMDGAP